MNRREFVKITGTSSLIALVGISTLPGKNTIEEFIKQELNTPNTNTMTVILYMTKHGTTRKVAEMIKLKLASSNVTLIDLSEVKNPDISKYNTIIIGGSIHAGMIQKRIKNFCKTNMELLMDKRLGLYLCCMSKGDKTILQLNDAYPEELQDHAECTQLMGGEYLFEKMNFMERAIVKKISGYTETKSEIDYPAIEKFSSDLASKQKGVTSLTM